MRHFGVIICLVFVLCVAVRGQHARRRAQPRLQHHPLSGQQPRRRAQPRGPGGPPPKPHSQPTARCSNTIPEKMSTKFYFYDKENHIIPRIISVDKIKSGAFNNTNLKRYNKFLIHGHNSQGWKKWTWVMKEEYLKKEDYIVIVIDWSDYDCTDPPYPNYELRAHVKVVAELICDFLVFLHQNQYVYTANFHLIGHGIGAYVAGVAGNCTYSKLGYYYGRITGLDPVATSGLPFLKLNNNAPIVDVIYTSGELLGDPKPRGKYNFYPNGGMRQPGCTTAECSHSRAVDYFIESINSKRFEATPCNHTTIAAGKGDTCVPGSSTIMGDNFVDNDQRFGHYYLKTNSHPPFARGPQ